ncbi:prolipoprotein diacylglyceryl transferase [Nonlabens mediterrranea]|uniref:Prolipoprotein diacylglyceryl transferase n=1 Tax=Nonlabens mediterrranea TaxID=1419947 RepID=A0ABS0A5B7_9FLAO|nr:prolipoprotein diacylglyceryl transferase [Nonlabens mediterrranea]
MQKFKKNWDITSNWQLIFPLLGIIGLLACGYFVATRIMPSTIEDVMYEYLFIYLVTLVLAYLFYRFCMWVFPKLIQKWKVQNRWEMIAIFIVFAITGSASARLSAPLLELIGLDKSSMSGWFFWPLRLLIIFPIYQVLLVVMGWLFGQFEFFWAFEKKMLTRFGIKL